MRVCATGRDDDCSAWAGTICLIKRDGGPILVGLAQRTLRSLFPQRNCLGLCGEVAGLSKAHDGAQQQKINEKSHEEPPDETNIIRDSVRGISQLQRMKCKPAERYRSTLERLRHLGAFTYTI